jgi:hypothetical protein
MIWESKIEVGRHVYFGGFELADSQKAQCNAFVKKRLLQDELK